MGRTGRRLPAAASRPRATAPSRQRWPRRRRPRRQRRRHPPAPLLSPDRCWHSAGKQGEQRLCRRAPRRARAIDDSNAAPHPEASSRAPELLLLCSTRCRAHSSQGGCTGSPQLLQLFRAGIRPQLGRQGLQATQRGGHSVLHGEHRLEEWRRRVTRRRWAAAAPRRSCKRERCQHVLLTGWPIAVAFPVQDQAQRCRVPCGGAAYCHHPATVNATATSAADGYALVLVCNSNEPTTQ